MFEYEICLVLAVISGATLGVHALRLVLDLLGKINRKVAIGVDNESNYPWEAINYYLAHGTSDFVLPFGVPSGKINVNNTKV